MQPGSDFKYFERFLSPPLRVKDNLKECNSFHRNCTTEECYGNVWSCLWIFLEVYQKAKCVRIGLTEMYKKKNPEV